MTRHDLMDRMSGYELTAWIALDKVRAEEREHDKDLAESGDGKVYVSGRDDDIDDPPDEGEDEIGPDGSE